MVAASHDVSTKDMYSGARRRSVRVSETNIPAHRLGMGHVEDADSTIGRVGAGASTSLNGSRRVVCQNKARRLPNRYGEGAKTRRCAVRPTAPRRHGNLRFELRDAD